MSSARKNKVPEVIFLIGAGVSIPIGIPAMHGIYLAFLDKSKSRITSEEKKTCQFFTEELGVAEDLEEFLVAANAIAEFKLSSISPLVERAISRQKNTNSINDYRKRLDQYIRSAADVRRRILDFMSRMCFQFDRSKALDIFGNFVHAVGKKGYPIYSTNYDYTLEYVAVEKNIAVHDNFMCKGQRYLWNSKIDYPLGDALTIVKLHGSVTWYSDDDGVIEKIYSSTDINLDGKNVDRLVIFPTRFKDIYEQNFFALYSHFLSNLSTARVLVITGHSLRDDYLRAAIIERYRKGNFLVIVIDPSYPDMLPNEIRPVRLRKAGRVTHVPFKFEEFSDELAGIVLSAKPENLPQTCAEVVHHIRTKTNKITTRGNIGILRCGSTKNFTASVDAYLRRQDKPACIRVWLEAEYTTPDGQKHSEVSAEFLEDKSVEIGTDLTGMIQSRIPMTFKVPTYTKWIEHVSRVTLHVAIVNKSVKKPNLLRPISIIAEDKRELTYKR